MSPVVDGVTIRIPREKQGQTGLGQGGWGCYEFQRAIGEPVTVALRSGLPLDVELVVVHEGDRWLLIDPAWPDQVILEATRWVADYPATEPVSIDQAEAARAGFPLADEEHPAPHCLSCGIGERTLGVHAGPLDDGRWASPLRFPDWSLVDDRRVDDGLVWMAMDCACGWYTTHSGSLEASGLTVQFAVDIIEPLDPNSEYALVAWHGDHAPDWDGRKRGAAAAVFDASGGLVAQSRSFWVRPR